MVSAVMRRIFCENGIHVFGFLFHSVSQQFRMRTSQVRLARLQAVAFDMVACSFPSCSFFPT
jgi:hypothetical protein